MDQATYEEISKALYDYSAQATAADVEVSKALIAQGYPEDCFIYGTTPIETFREVISNVKMQPKRFVDIGASIGWMCFYWDYLYGTPSVGIDIHSSRIEFGVELAKKYDLKNIHLSVFDVNKFEVKEGDLLWLNNTCFDLSFTKDLIEKLFGERQNIALVSYQFIVTDEFPAWRYMYRLRLKTSWCNEQPFFIYEREDPSSS